MELEILRCVGEDEKENRLEPCQSSPKYRIEGLGIFCGRHGKQRLFDFAVSAAKGSKKPALTAASR